MITDNTQLLKSAGLPTIALAAAFFLSACASVPESTAEADTLQPAEEAGDMRAECMAMHEKMKEKMAEGDMQMNESMMSPEMREKHQQCMEMMSEMSEMCTAMHEGKMEDHKESMGDHCAAMMHGSQAHEHEDGEDQ